MSGQIFRVPSFDRGAKKDERPLNDLPLDALPLSGKVRILDLSSGVKFKVLSMAATLPPMSAISTEESPSLLKKRRRKKKKRRQWAGCHVTKINHHFSFSQGDILRPLLTGKYSLY